MQSFLCCLAGTPNKRESFTGSSFVDITFLALLLHYLPFKQKRRVYQDNKGKASDCLNNCTMHHQEEQGNKGIYFPINNFFGEGECQRLQEFY